LNCRGACPAHRLAELAGGPGGNETAAGSRAAGDLLVLGAAQATGHKKNPDLPMERIVTLVDFASALREVAADAGGEYVLVGGLCVGAWASAFEVGDGSPMYSKDIDLRGTRLAAKAVVQALKREGALVKGFFSVVRKVPPGLGKNYV